MSSFDVSKVDLSRSSFIEASAGTGKTHALVGLVLRLLLEEGLPLKNLCVVTFTIAAAEELRVRIETTLASLLASFKQPSPSANPFVPNWQQRYEAASKVEQRDWVARLNEALLHYDEATITTLHGFANRILNDFAFEGHFPLGHWEVGDDKEWIQLATEDFWRHYFYNKKHDENFIAHLQEVHGLSSLSKPTDIVKQYLTRQSVLQPGKEQLLRELEVARKGSANEWEVRAMLFWHDLVDFTTKRIKHFKARWGYRSFDDLLDLVLNRLNDSKGTPKPFGDLIRERYKVALIDEFQDTDHKQYVLFSKLFGATERLFMIGDPKQSIFRFRGTNVQSYFLARRNMQVHSMDVNWRSDDLVLRVTNALFANNPFDDERMQTPSLKPATPNATSKLLVGGEADSKPVKLWYLSSEDKKPTGIGKAKPMFANAVARDALRLLNPKNTVTVGGRPIKPGDIAVLCHRHEEIDHVKRAMRRVRIPYRTVEQDNPFLGEEATSLYEVLAAVHSPKDLGLVRAALVGPLIGESIPELSGMDSKTLDEHAKRFATFKEAWLQRGFLAMANAFESTYHPRRTLVLGLGDPKRVLNFVRLVRFLGHASHSEEMSPTSLLRFFGKHLQQELPEEAFDEPLKSQDKGAVNLITIHASKGLEYPVVYCPFAWRAYSARPGKSFASFQSRESPESFLIHPNTKPDSEAAKQEDKEASEDLLRVLYVALTRAKYRLVVGYGDINKVEDSAFARVLDSLGSAPKGFDALRSTVKSQNLPWELLDLDEVQLQDDDFLFFSGNVDEAKTKVVLRPPPKPKGVRSGFETSSFSSLASGSREENPLGELFVEPTSGEAPPTEGVEEPLSSLRGGAQTGLLLHNILEDWMQSDSDAAAFESHVKQLGDLHGLSPSQQQAVIDLLARLENLKLGDLRPRGLQSREVFTEVHFTYPIGGATADEFSSLLRPHSPYNKMVLGSGGLAYAPLGIHRGFFKGVIDLVLQHEGRYTLVDWKSNQLGKGAGAYSQANLERAMANSHYFLQGVFYLLGLHLKLKSSLEGYDYRQQIGGMYYVFLRGLRGDGSGGVYHFLPPQSLIESMEELLVRGQ